MDKIFQSVTGSGIAVREATLIRDTLRIIKLSLGSGGLRGRGPENQFRTDDDDIFSIMSAIVKITEEADLVIKPITVQFLTTAVIAFFEDPHPAITENKDDLAKLIVGLYQKAILQDLVRSEQKETGHVSFPTIFYSIGEVARDKKLIAELGISWCNKIDY